MPITATSPSGPGIALERDKSGRITHRALSLGTSAEIRRYAYDLAGRLARVTDDVGTLCESYQYDHEGRRLADINPARFRGERRYSYAAKNRLSQAGRTLYGHDAAGFRCLKAETTPQGDRETRYEYEPSGLLLAVDLPDKRRIEYVYDSTGMRREKRVTANGVGRVVEAYTWLDPLRLEEFFDGRQWWRLVYDPEQGRRPVGVTNGSESYLILADQIGTPVALASLDGAIVQTMRYDSFGNPLRGLQGVVQLPLGFAGGLLDADTGLTRFVWRDYDADTGRFTALDPLGKKGGDKDWYGYCVDDPVNRTDAWGLWSMFGFGDEEQKADGGSTAQGSTGRDDNPYCKWYPCDDNGTMQGDYKPIDIHSGAEPFLLDNSFPLPDILAGPFRSDGDNAKEIRVPLGFDFIDPFRAYYERNK